jgi:hypothetical protein
VKSPHQKKKKKKKKNKLDPAGSQKIKEFLNFLLSRLVYSQIWLNHVENDCHFDHQCHTQPFFAGNM